MSFLFMTLDFFLKVCGNPPTLMIMTTNWIRKHCAFSILEYIAKCFYVNLCTLETSECRMFVNELITVSYKLITYAENC